MRALRHACSTASVIAALSLPGVAMAQRAGDNAVNNAEDAFGTSVGLESTGIYTENDTRGFSPKKAGNVRIDGIYFDQVSVLSGRLRESTAIRVGFAAEDYPFNAPTGIVDNKFKPFPKETGLSVGFNRNAYWGSIGDFDVRLPIVKDHIGLTGGMAYADSRMADGVTSFSWGVSVRPIFRFARTEVSPFIHFGWFPRGRPQPLVVLNGDRLPVMPPLRRYLGQEWANAGFQNTTRGVTIKSALSNKLSLRGGIFRSGGKRLRSFSDIFTITDQATGLANHRFFADPEQDVHSTSGEAQLALRFGKGLWQHRIVAGYRARNRYTESGGTDFGRSNFGQVIYGERDPEPQPDFEFGPVNAGRVRQASLLLGYVGKLKDVGLINLGLQRARYRATFRDGRSGAQNMSRDDLWLYNATIGVDLTPRLALYAGTQKGLEDSGTAPDNAVNRGEQLAATRATQYEGGLRWKFRGGQLAVNLFQITKPYFSFDAARVFTQVGNVRHRGVEASLSGQFGKRLNLLAGALAMQPRVSGPAFDQGLIGKLPAGTPAMHLRIDANYRTDLFGGLTPTASLSYHSARALGERPLDASGRQLMVPGYTTLDLGLRQQFKMGNVPASFRFVLSNVFDTATWKIVAANTLHPEDRRRFSLSLAADF